MIFHQIFRDLVVSHRLVTVDYFMNSLELWEVETLYDSLPYVDVNLWEVGRLISYNVIAPYMKSKKKLKEYMALPWEKGDNNSETTDDKEKLNALKNRAISLEKILQNKTTNGNITT